MRSPFLALLLLTASPLAGSAAVAQDQISRLKLAPQDFRDRQIRLEGEVVELRGISPRSGQGMYRLVDASDRIGVLVRSSDLPTSGGPFKIRARLSPELLSDGVLLLDEIDRSAARLPLLPLAGGIGALGLVTAVVALTMLLRTRHAQRHMRLAPPMWLIPTGADPRQEAPTGTEHRFNYHLQYIEEERSEHLDQRKRVLIAMLAVASGVGLAGTGWFALLSREDAARPSFVLVTPVEPEPVPTTLPNARDTIVAHRPDDTLRLGLEPPEEPRVTAAAPPPAPPPAPRREIARETSARTREQTPATRPRTDTTRRVVAVQPPPVARDTITVQPPPVVVVMPPPPPPPPPPPAPAPPPAEPRRDTAAFRPPVNPETLRAEASVELRAGIDRFVEAIRTRQPGVVDLMYVPEQGEDERRKAKFVSFLKESAPGVSLAAMETVAVTETSGGTRFTLQFRWRGDFGVDRRKAVRFWGAARREGSRWTFSGVRLLESFP